MRFRRESLHERLAREGGLTEDAVPAHDPGPRWGEVGIHGVPRPREWDVVLTAEAAGLDASDAEFTALDDRTVLLDEGLSEEQLEPLVVAVEEALEPPFRAKAVRQHGDVWAVAARRIEVASLPDAPGDELELTMRDGSRTFTVDGAQEFGTDPTLERLAGERFDSYAASATRLDGDMWEVRISPL